jgi:hypothetical protein
MSRFNPDSLPVGADVRFIEGDDPSYVGFCVSFADHPLPWEGLKTLLGGGPTLKVSKATRVRNVEHGRSLLAKARSHGVTAAAPLVRSTPTPRIRMDVTPLMTRNYTASVAKAGTPDSPVRALIRASGERVGTMDARYDRETLSIDERLHSGEGHTLRDVIAAASEAVPGSGGATWKDGE